jgi:hypothetical protein
MCEELATCNTKHISSYVLGSSPVILSESLLLLGKSGACKSSPTCLPELLWGLNSTQQTSTDTYSVPGPVLGEAGSRDEETQPLPSGCSV